MSPTRVSCMQMGNSLQRAKQYKVSAGFRYRPLNALFPQAKTGHAGSTCPVALHHSNELHALYRFKPPATLRNWLLSHLRILLGQT